MKLSTLLENMNPSSIMFSDLSPEQIGVIVKLNSGEIDIDSADERQFDIMTDLRGMGVIDQEWGLSREGRAAAQHAEQNGGSHDLQKARERSIGGSDFVSDDLGPDELGNDTGVGFDEEEQETEFKF